MVVLVFGGCNDGKGMEDLKEVKYRGGGQAPGELVKENTLHPQQLPGRTLHASPKHHLLR